MKFSTKLPHDIQKTARRKLVMLNAIQSLVNNKGFTIDEAMEALEIPNDKRSVYKASLE